LFGKGCASCGSASSKTFFDYGASSTFQVAQCTASGYNCGSCAAFDGVNSCSFNDGYGDGSDVSGSFATDVFGVPGLSGVANVAFGVITVASTNFEPAPVDGIWGISYPDLAVTTPSIDTLIEAKSFTNAFSMCLQEQNAVMSIGIDYSKNPGFQWTPIVKQEYYNVQITDLRVNGVTLGLTTSQLNNPFTIVDSGTTLVVLEQASYLAFATAVENACTTPTCGNFRSLLNGNCVSLTGSEIAAYPTVEFYFQSINNPFTITYEDYILPNGGNSYCLGVVEGSSGDGTILGDVFMQNFHVVFDRVNSQIGFGDNSTCPTPSSSDPGSASSNWSSLWMMIMVAILLQFV